MKKSIALVLVGLFVMMFATTSMAAQSKEYKGKMIIYVKDMQPTYIQLNILLFTDSTLKSSRYLKLDYTYVGVENKKGYTDCDTVKYVQIIKEGDKKYFIIPVFTSGDPLKSPIPAGTSVNEPGYYPPNVIMMKLATSLQ